MSTVTPYAAPTPMTRTQSNHARGVGRGSLACQQSKRKAATTETMNCKNRMGEL